MAATGTATLDFGAFPGAAEASIAVTGQTGIVAGSLVEAWRMPTVATADKTTDEQRIERLEVVADTISAGIGFTIRGRDAAVPAWKDVNYIKGRDGGAQKQRVYGKYLIGWAWT